MFPFLTSFFANPALLGGAAAGSIPIIIHLLNKQRFKRTVWAAMHWLWAAQRKAHKRQRIEQLILLLIRVLILVLLALALARPALQEGLGLLQGSTSIHRIIVLDNSYSMGLGVGGQTLFDKGKTLAEHLIKGLKPGDDIDVLLMNTTVEELPSNSKLSEVIRDLQAAQLSDGGTHVPRGIAAACKLIAERQSKNLRKEIIVITDRTRAGWETGTTPKKVDRTEEEWVAHVFADPKLKPRIWVARLQGGDSRENLVAASVEVDERVVTMRADTQFSATFRNLGTQPVERVPVTLYVDGEAVQKETIPHLKPQEPQTVNFRYVFPDAGSHAVHVALEPDLLPSDNTSYLAVDVEEQVKVLCVDGQQLAGPLKSEMDFFRQALSPSHADDLSVGRMPLMPEVINDSALQDANLDNYRLVVLGNVALVPKEKIEALTQYVKRGGALWIWLGHRTNPAIYNQDLAALLPCVIGEAVGDEQKRDVFEKISDKHADHPAVERFRNIKGLAMHEMHTYRRYQLTPKVTADGAQPTPEQQSVRTVMAYENGEAAVMEMRVGEGRVLLVGTTADKEWNNWPGRNHYMPLVNFLTLDLIQPAYLLRNRMVGEPFEYRLPRESVAESRRQGVELISPAGDPIPTEIDNSTFSVISKPVGKAGIYKAKIAAEKPFTVHFASNRNLDESELDTIDDRDLQASLPADATATSERARFFDAPVTLEDVEFSGDDALQIEASLKKHSSGKEIWRWLVAAVIVLLLAESFLAQRFGNYGK